MFSIKNPLVGVQDFGGVMKLIAQGVMNLVIPVAVVMIVWAGFNFMTAAGEPAKIKKGKDILKWTVVGLAIIFIGGGFIDLIKSVLSGGR